MDKRCQERVSLGSTGQAVGAPDWRRREPCFELTSRRFLNVGHFDESQFHSFSVVCLSEDTIQPVVLSVWENTVKAKYRAHVLMCIRPVVGSRRHIAYVYSHYKIKLNEGMYLAH